MATIDALISVSDRQQIARLCEGTLNATLSLEVFHDTWQSGWSDSPFLHQCFGDMEDCIEHMPGTKEGPLPIWYSSHERLLVQVDLFLLQTTGKDETELLRCRERLYATHLARIDLSSEVERCLNENESTPSHPAAPAGFFRKLFR